MPDVAELIRTARTSAGLTQQELARRAATTGSLIARYESGAVSPTVRALSRLLEACGQRLLLATSADPAVHYGAPTPAPRGSSDYLNRPASGWTPSAGH